MAYFLFPSMPEKAFSLGLLLLLALPHRELNVDHDGKQLLILLSSWNRFSTMFILLSVCVCVHVFVYSFILHFLFALFFVYMKLYPHANL